MMMDLGFCLIFYLLIGFLIPENGLDSFVVCYIGSEGQGY